MPAAVFEVIRVCKTCEQNGVANCRVCRWWACDLCVEHALRVKGEKKFRVVQ